MVMQLQSAVGGAAIAAVEAGLAHTARTAWAAHPKIRIAGTPPSHVRVGIVAFNVRALVCWRVAIGVD